MAQNLEMPSGPFFVSKFDFGKTEQANNMQIIEEAISSKEGGEIQLVT